MLQPIYCTYCDTTSTYRLTKMYQNTQTLALIFQMGPFVLSQSTRLRDRQTDTFLAIRPPCIQCSAVKKLTKNTEKQKYSEYSRRVREINADTANTTHRSIIVFITQHNDQAEHQY